MGTDSGGLVMPGHPPHKGEQCAPTAEALPGAGTAQRALTPLQPPIHLLQFLHLIKSSKVTLLKLRTQAALKAEREQSVNG